MSFALGTARGRIEIDYDGSGVAEAEKDVDGLEKKSGNSIKSINTLGNTAGVAGLAIAAGFAVAVNQAASFEQRMSAIGAVSGASGKQMDSLRDKALQLGKDTQFSAGESAAAIEELIKAGLSVTDVLNGAADATVNLAAAGEIDMAQAATIASNSMNQFNLKAKDMTGVVDSIAGAANASAIDVGEFGQSLQQVGAVANLAGVSFDDTATAIAIMGNQGIRGSDAGTSLKSMFQRLQPVTKKQAELFKELGIITEDGTNKFYDQQGNLKDLGSVSQVLQNSLKGMTAQQKQATLQTLFGSDAIRGAAILSNAGAKGFNKMSDAMGKVSAADVAKKRMDNFKGSLEQMKGSLETAGIAVGTILLPPLRSLVDMITGAANWFLNLSDTTQKWIISVLAAVSALLLIIAGIAKTIVFINTVRTALVGLRGTMIATWAAALGPIALVIAIIAAVVVAIVILWKKSETFRRIVLAVWAAIKAAAQAVANWFTGSLVPWLVNAWNAIKDAAVTAWNALVSFLKAAMTLLFNIVTAPIRLMFAVWSAMWNLFGPAVKAIFDLIVAIFKLWWTIVKGLFILYLRLLMLIWKTVWRGIMAVVRPIWNAIKAIIGAALRFVVGVIKAQLNLAKSIIKGIWEFIKGATERVWNGMIKPIVEFIGKVIDKVNNLKDRVVGFFADAGQWLFDAGKKIVQGLIDGIANMAGSLKDKVEDLTGIIGKFLPGSPVREGPLRILNQGYAGKQIVKMLMDGIKSQAFALEGTVGDVASLVPSGIAPVGGRGGVVRRGKGSGRKAMRMEGDLTLRNGRAYISGIVTDVMDDDEQFKDTKKGQGDG